MQLASAAWNEMNTRREYEWKVNFALWPALAILAGFLLQGKLAPDATLKWSLSGGLILIALMYIFLWSAGLHSRNASNQRAAAQYWKMVEDAIGINTGYHVPKDANSMWCDWARSSQILITVILILISFVGLHRPVRSNSEAPVTVTVPVTVIDCNSGRAAAPKPGSQLLGDKPDKQAPSR